MSNLRSAVRLTSSFVSPVVLVLLVVLLQAILLGAYFYLGSQDKIRIQPAEAAVLIVYSALAIASAIAIGIARHRWMQREDQVRQRLLDVIDAIPDPSAVRDMKGRYVMWNKAAETYHGIKAEHVLGKTPFELFPRDVARQLLELDAECSSSNKTVIRRVTLPPLYGKGLRSVSIHVAPVLSAASADVRGFITVLRDITEQEREASSLRHLSTQLKMALDTSGFGSWIWDLESNTVTYSAQYKVLLRYKGDSFEQDFDFLSRIHPGDSAVVAAAAKSSLKMHTPFDQVYRLRGFDEVYRYFHASGESAFDDKGRRYFAGLLCPLDRTAD
jgi:PAS domain S-box-containing protein